METPLFVRLYHWARSAIASLWEGRAGRSDFRVDQVVLPVIVQKGSLRLRGNAFLIDPEQGIFVTCAHVLGLGLNTSRARISVFFDGAWSKDPLGRHVIFANDDVAFFRVAPNVRHIPMQYAAELPRDGFRLHLMGFLGATADDDPVILHDVPLFSAQAMWRRRTGVRDTRGSILFPFPCVPARTFEMRDFRGLSGSPVVSRDGTVFGMVHAQTESGFLLVISIVRIKALLEKVRHEITAP